jgi:hypothetical protein
MTPAREIESMEVSERDLAQLKGMIVVQKGKVAFKSTPIYTH